MFSGRNLLAQRLFRAARLVMAAVTAGFLPSAMVACNAGPRVGISDVNGINKAVVRVEIADTGAARELGLMYRQHLAPDAGMLFVFKQQQHLTFWMKNTEIPLDMIFAAPDGTVTGIIANAEPFSERELSVAGNSQYVLEVNAGFARRHGVKAGDKLAFTSLRPDAKD
jgi:uncharacterized protein